VTDPPNYFTPSQQQLLDFFMANSGKWFCPKVLVMQGLGYEYSGGKFGDSQLLRWHIKNLRRKIGVGVIDGRKTSFDGRSGYRWRYTGPKNSAVRDEHLTGP